MCIRDRGKLLVEVQFGKYAFMFYDLAKFQYFFNENKCDVCLLYTSDAADERSSVDLGGRRIIKKKKSIDVSVVCHLYQERMLARSNNT